MKKPRRSGAVVCNAKVALREAQGNPPRVPLAHWQVDGLRRSPPVEPVVGPLLLKAYNTECRNAHSTRCRFASVPASGLIWRPVSWSRRGLALVPQHCEAAPANLDLALADRCRHAVARATAAIVRQRRCRRHRQVGPFWYLGGHGVATKQLADVFLPARMRSIIVPPGVGPGRTLASHCRPWPTKYCCGS